jgi:DNA-binding HxlR family transcriptional regulator
MGAKYKPLLVYFLMENGVLRFGESQRLLPEASKKMLTRHLRELERDDIIRRKVFTQVPPKVEYSLTARGKSPYCIPGWHFRFVL